MAKSLNAVAKAVKPLEGKLARMIVQAVSEAQQAVPLGKLADTVMLGPSAAVGVMEGAVATLGEALQVKPSRAMRTAIVQKGSDLNAIITAALNAGASANELCVLATPKGEDIDKVREIYTLWKSGVPTNEIGSKFGMSYYQVRGVLNRIKTQAEKYVGIVRTPAPMVEAWPIAEGVTRKLGTNFPTQMREAYATWIESLSVEELGAISHYTSSGYSEINALLRGKLGGFSNSELIAAKKQARLIEEAMARASAPPPPELVWRGTQNQGGKEFADKLATGDIFEMKGFQSTSINPTLAYRWAGGEGSGIGILFEIKPRVGAYIRDVSDHKNEFEFLLPHNAKYKVTGRTTVPIQLEGRVAKRTVIQLEMLP